jgi:hypothetical protein
MRHCTASLTGAEADAAVASAAQARRSAILMATEARHRPKLAEHLASETRMSVAEAAAASLRAAPRAPATRSDGPLRVDIVQNMKRRCGAPGFGRVIEIQIDTGALIGVEIGAFDWVAAGRCRSERPSAPLRRARSRRV